MSISAMHYGTEFKIEVLDASTEYVVGSSLVSTQGLLQWQRDDLALEGGLTMNSVIAQAPLTMKKRKVVIELRTGVKSGFGLDYYNADKLGGSTRAGEISGWVEVEICFEEDQYLYSNTRPKPCPSRPLDDFNMELIQLHIARIFSLIEGITELVNAYFYLVGWKNPALTSLSLIIFVTLCLRFNAEYFGSLPLASIIIYMLYRASKRKKGYRDQLQIKEKDARLKDLKCATVQYRNHRPAGTLKVNIVRGKNLSPHLGIPGSLVCTATWDPTKFANEKTKKDIHDYDKSSVAAYHIGETESSAVTFNPEWKRLLQSDELQRLKQLLPSTNFLSRSSSHELNNSHLGINGDDKDHKNALEMPILQPIARGQEATITLEGEEESVEQIELKPWESSKAALVVQVRFTDVLNILPMFDQVLGDVVIPFYKIYNDNKISGWFQVLPKGTLETIEIPQDLETTCDNSFLARLTNPDDETPEKDNQEKKNEVPMIYLEAEFIMPGDNFTDIDRETSIVVAEHMISSASASEDIRVGFIGSSISTFNTVRGVTGQVQFIQNQLGNVLNYIEIIRNAFNFTCPEKSAFILCCIGTLWLLFALIPTRFVILAAGLGQYIATFMSFISVNDTSASAGDKEIVATRTSSDVDESYNPYVTRIKNFFMSIPTNEDLRRYYFWEARKVGEREREIWASKRRAARLTKLYQAQWFGRVELKMQNVLEYTEDGRNWDWVWIFAIIQGHRFVWWRSEKDFDEGENPSGQIFFAGHSGLAGLSPLELRELRKKEIPKVVNIFGRGSKEQLKISLLVSDEAMKESLENAVLNATHDAKIE